MALVDLGKQLAQQALTSAIARDKEPSAPAPPPAETSGLVVFSQLRAMEKALKEDEELVVTFQSGAERIRVMEIFLPSPQIAVLSGLDANRATTRVISAVSALQLVLKTVKIAPGAKPARLGLITPRPKDSSA